MTQTQLNFENPYVDVTANKSHSPATSIAANKKIAPHKMNWRDKILEYMTQREQIGWVGVTLQEVCRYYDKERGQLSGRFTELVAMGLIEKTGEIRDGFAVYKLK